MYTIEKNLTRLMNNQSTFFLDPREQELLKRKLNKHEYKIFKPYNDSEKVIFYNGQIPKVYLYQIKSKQKLRHQDILGAIFSLNISSEMIGDIIINDGNYYVYVFDLIRNYFESNLINIKNSTVELLSLNLDFLEDFKRNYEQLEIIVSSCRIDTVISAVIHSSRTIVKEKIKNKEIMLNHDILNNNSYILKHGDIFSIRRYGKYKYMGIIKQTKKDNYIIRYLKYL